MKTMKFTNRLLMRLTNKDVNGINEIQSQYVAECIVALRRLFDLLCIASTINSSESLLGVKDIKIIEIVVEIIICWGIAPYLELDLSAWILKGLGQNTSTSSYQEGMLT